MKRLLLIILLAFSATVPALATHIVGGNLNYQHLGGNQYRVTLVLYRDCNGGQANFDNPAALGIFNSQTGALVQTLSMALDAVVQLESTINSSCVTFSSDICVEAGYYTDDVTLPPTAAGYTLAYQRCCRNGIIQNIDNPGDVGTTIVAAIPGTTSFPANSNPVWNQLPPIFVCANLPFTFAHAATDPDGDLLVYSLYTPFEGASAAAPQPNPPGGPPYTPVTWGAGFSQNNMLGGTSNFTINSGTGVITALPGTLGNYLVGLLVQEFRNGQLLGATMREFQLNVINCQAPVAQPIDINSVGITAPFTNCTPFVQFQAQNTSGYSIAWNFGDPSTTLDVSTLQNPTWTYPGPGVYPLTLSVFDPNNPNDPLCSNTVTQNITVQPPVEPDAGADVDACSGSLVQIGGSAVAGHTYQWSPTTGLSNPTSSTTSVTSASNQTYTVTETDQVGCTGTDAVTVTVNPLPNINAGPASLETCEGFFTQLQASGGGGGATYSWSPVAGLSNANIQNPTATISTPTIYTVTGTDANGCENTDQISLTLFTVQATSSGDYCIGGSAQLSANGGQSWTWSPATGLSSTTVQNPTANPTVTTVYTVTANNGLCDASDDVTQQVNQLPNIQAGTNLQVCPGSNAQLNATGGVSYVWSPAAGLSNPNIANPIVTLSGSSATYSVVGTDANGCENTDQVTVSELTLPAVSALPAFSNICAGESVNLTATGGTAYAWTPAGGLNDPSIANPVATPTASTTYTVSVTQPTGNLVVNGAFDAGNVGFTSDYTFSNNVQPEALYSVVDNANTVHPAFQGTGHTGNSPDNFMVVNGAGTPGLDVWCQTVSVSPNTDYSFSTWVSTLVGGSPAVLQFSINGTPLATPFNAPFNVGVWNQFFQNWNSGAASTATICILNQNTTLGGNDFGLDDITFSTVCTQTADAQIDVNPLPTPDAGADIAFCRGDGVQLNASTGLSSYQWIPPLGLNNANIADPFANPFNTTTYTLVVQDALGCEGQDQITVTVNPLPVASAGPDASVCVGDGVVLQGSGGTDYNWSPGTFLDDASSQLPLSTPTSDITYVLQVIDGNGCEDTDSVDVTVNPLPVISAGPDSTLCIGGSMVLNATGGISYVWSPSAGLSDPGSGNPTATPIDPVTYTVTGTDANGCSSSDQIALDFFIASAGPDSIICLNQTVQAFVNGGVSYQWTPTDGVSDPTSPNPTITPSGNTTYTVTVTSYAGCIFVAQLSLAVLTLPSSQFVATFEPTCEGVLGIFDNQSQNSEDQQWNFGDGTVSGDDDVFHVYPPGQGYVVSLITYNNDSLCSDTITIDFTDQWVGNDSIDIQYGSAFTPNNDGLNDCFMPFYEGDFSGCYELTVYNRWGGLIFENTAGDGQCWDGRTKAGNMVDPGTYYYIVHVKGYEHTGFVTLVP